MHKNLELVLYMFGIKTRLLLDLYLFHRCERHTPTSPLPYLFLMNSSPLCLDCVLAVPIDAGDEQSQKLDCICSCFNRFDGKKFNLTSEWSSGKKGFAQFWKVFEQLERKWLGDALAASCRLLSCLWGWHVVGSKPKCVGQKSHPEISMKDPRRL